MKKQIFKEDFMKARLLFSVLILACGLLCLTSGCDLKGTGTLTLNLTDDPGEYEEVFITFSEVSVHRGEEQDEVEGTLPNEGEDEEQNEEDDDSYWIVISEEEQGYDLLTLKDAYTLLAGVDLEEGIYTQIRLKIVDGNDANGDPKTYVKLVGDDTKYPLEVPSGTKSGLKLIHPFRITADSETVLYLDFDAEESVKQTGNGQYKLKPTIAILSDLSPNQGIQGRVYENESKTGIPDAGVSAYAYTEGVTGDGDESPVASTSTDEEGDFKLPLPAGTYTLKVEASGYETITTAPIAVEVEEWTLEDIPLSSSAS
jgi:hypothetical protein